MSLDEIFQEGITETVITTQSSEGTPNAAPMGVVRRGDSLLIRMYPNSRTYRNIADNGRLVACIMTDPMIFVVSAFHDLEEGFFIPQTDDSGPPLLKDACAWVSCEAIIEGTVRLRPIKYKILRKTVPRFSRGFASVIDATITGTRLKLLGDEGRKRIHDDAVIVKKCGTSRDIEAMAKLQEILNL
ncbi:MAG TPA: DUF447 domain-containing protein [Methanocella sp.]|nr:DUF447 domain-containing protein [Methanocella sp.]